MRHKPCWSDNFPLDIWYGWIAATGILAGILVVTECTGTPAQAALYVEAHGGVTQFLLTAPDGSWRQEPFAKKINLTDFAYRVGIGYSFSPRWSIQAHYVNLGASRTTAYAVNDSTGEYDFVNKRCLKNCDKPYPFTVSDKVHGFDLTVTHTWAGHTVEPFIKAGAAMLMHRLTYRNMGDPGTAFLYGRIPAVVFGAGACAWGWACADVTAYLGLGGPNCLTYCGDPVSTQAVVGMIGVKIPLGS